MDEDRRLLEREARYDRNVSNLLTCMREGHDPGKVIGAGYGEVHSELGGPRVCKRCRLVYVPDGEEPKPVPPQTPAPPQPQIEWSSVPGSCRPCNGIGTIRGRRCDECLGGGLARI